MCGRALVARLPCAAVPSPSRTLLSWECMGRGFKRTGERLGTGDSGSGLRRWPPPLLACSPPSSSLLLDPACPTLEPLSTSFVPRLGPPPAHPAYPIQPATAAIARSGEEPRGSPRGACEKAVVAREIGHSTPRDPRSCAELVRSSAELVESSAVMAPSSAARWRSHGELVQLPDELVEPCAAGARSHAVWVHSSAARSRRRAARGRPHAARPRRRPPVEGRVEVQSKKARGERGGGRHVAEEREERPRRVFREPTSSRGAGLPPPASTSSPSWFTTRRLLPRSPHVPPRSPHVPRGGSTHAASKRSATIASATLRAPARE
jgi:hypothetical protein